MSGILNYLNELKRLVKTQSYIKANYCFESSILTTQSQEFFSWLNGYAIDLLIFMHFEYYSCLKWS